MLGGKISINKKNKWQWDTNFWKGKQSVLSLVHIKSSERSLRHDFLFESVTILNISGFYTSFSLQQYSHKA